MVVTRRQHQREPKVRRCQEPRSAPRAGDPLPYATTHLRRGVRPHVSRATLVHHGFLSRSLKASSVRSPRFWGPRGTGASPQPASPRRSCCRRDCWSCGVSDLKVLMAPAFHRPVGRRRHTRAGRNLLNSDRPAFHRRAGGSGPEGDDVTLDNRDNVLHRFRNLAWRVVSFFSQALSMVSSSALAASSAAASPINGKTASAVVVRILTFLSGLGFGPTALGTDRGVTCADASCRSALACWSPDSWRSESCCLRTLRSPAPQTGVRVR